MKRKAILATLLTLAIVVTFGCSSRAKTDSVSRVQIPNGLTTREATAALVQTLNEKLPIDDQGKNWERIVDSLLSARVWGYESQFNPRGSGWYVENVNSDSVTYGYKRRRHYMRVKYEVRENEIVPTIIASENLDQSGKKIHPNAVQWVNDFSTRIRGTLGQLVIMKSEFLPK
ncbi:hypothetical protein M2447_001556 [Ereboglobus sp. PH5-10]|uniref:hypothetical protein n=1 Tax=Ereboglobus sp. PH5-10 TaxID=2940629 RepID=UPI0024060946|nr:hypothetical protein [Ereboglobus sp. PH5-10]MDF9827463.1 hypothetical protein [Ereboglobus sp. PH5-10]